VGVADVGTSYSPPALLLRGLYKYRHEITLVQV
jgi:hypothetical protein